MNDLTPDRLAALKALLEARKSTLLGQYADRPASERTPAVEEIETSPADSASNRTLNQLEAEADEHRLAQLAAIRHALAKFDQGEYGICEGCGGPIGASRLDARPEACLCTHMRNYNCWTCGHYTYRLKDTTHKLANGDYQILSAEHVFKDYQFSLNNEIALPEKQESVAA